MPKYKEITASEADVYLSLGVTFQILYNNDSRRHCWRDWDREGNKWTPSHYPTDGFRVEVE